MRGQMELPSLPPEEGSVKVPEASIRIVVVPANAPLPVKVVLLPVIVKVVVPANEPEPRSVAAPIIVILVEPCSAPLPAIVPEPEILAVVAPANAPRPSSVPDPVIVNVLEPLICTVEPPPAVLLSQNITRRFGAGLYLLRTYLGT